MKSAKKGQSNIQYLLTFFVFIIMLIFVVFTFLVKYASFYSQMQKKTQTQDLLLAQSSLIDMINNNKGEINPTLLNLIKRCDGIDYYNPSTKEINPYYLKIKNYLSIPSKRDIQIRERKYILLLANETIDENTTSGYYLLYPSTWIKFVINKSKLTQKKFDLLTLYPPSSSPVYLYKDYTYDFNNEEYLLEIIDIENGRYALFESVNTRKCGPRLQSSSEIAEAYAGVNNTIIKFEIEIW